MEKRYYTFNSHLREKFGCKVYKVTINAGFTCPNRDGKIGKGGCIYCNNEGFNPNDPSLSVKEQIEAGKRFMKKRYKAKKFIAYFQAYTNTYAPVHLLKSLYDEAVSCEDIVGLSVGTRPDCVPDAVLDLLETYKDRYYTWVEYGLQSAHFKTLKIINRGHGPSEFIDAVLRTKKRGIKICAHIILGLPKETKRDMIETAKFLTALQVDAVKIHLIHILKNTILEKMYLKGRFRVPEMDEYVDWVCDFIEHLSPNIMIQRLTADGPLNVLVAPRWAIKKFDIINAIDKELERRDSWQGKKCRLGLSEEELFPNVPSNFEMAKGEGILVEKQHII